MRPDRRTVLAAGGALAGSATLARAAGRGRPGALILFDPREASARAFAEARAGRAAPLEGDRIRLARRLLAQGGPERLTVVGRHADVLLVSEAAREAGYRKLAHEPFPALDGGLYLWSGQRRA